MNKLLIKHASQIATPQGFECKKGSSMKEIFTISDGAVYIEDGIIKLMGKTDEVLNKIDEKNCKIIDAEGKCVLPGFVDSHTHFIFSGYREDEFVKRLEGAEYIDILNLGGGIQSTVKNTRNSTFEELYSLGKDRLKNMISQGITTVEGKSGYGLDLDCEIKMLKVMKKLNEDCPIDVVSTFLGAHAVPLEYKNKNSEYVDYMINEVLPKVAEEDLAEFCDVFCEEGVFSIEESK